MLDWVESNGGPLLLLQRDLLGFWEGTRPSAAFRNVEAQFRWKDDPAATDYDRACDVDDYVGVIDIGPGVGLVLGDEPLPTTHFSSGKNRQDLLVRWIYANGDDDVVAAIEGGLSDLNWTAGPEYRVDQSELVLFDSAFAGDEVPVESLRIVLPCGRYVVQTGKLDFDSTTALLIHRFSPNS